MYTYVHACMYVCMYVRTCMYVCMYVCNVALPADFASAGSGLARTSYEFFGSCCRTCRAFPQTQQQPKSRNKPHHPHIIPCIIRTGSCAHASRETHSELPKTRALNLHADLMQQLRSFESRQRRQYQYTALARMALWISWSVSRVICMYVFGESIHAVSATISGFRIDSIKSTPVSRNRGK